jgi:hypothetical protein
MEEVKTQLEEIYTYVRSRDYNKVFLTLSLNDFIEAAKKNLYVNGNKQSKLAKLQVLENKIDSVIDRAIKLGDNKA